VNFRYPICLALLSLLAAAGAWAKLDDAQIVKDFEARVSNYVEVHKQAGTAKPTDSATKLAEAKDQRAQKLRSARPDAKQGDIFAPEIASYFRRQIAATLAGQDGDKIRATLRHAEPLADFSLQVNARYPEKTPLQSTPPTLLLNLPRLPDKLQYRIVGHALLLYDAGTDLIVDFIADAVRYQ
jgi:hypothetical protein